MLTSASFENFKSIKKLDKLELKPLTILTGTNASGKSAILEGIGLFADAARESLFADSNKNTIIGVFTDPQGLWRYPREELQKFVVHKGDRKNSASIEIEVKTDDQLQKSIDSIVNGYHISRFTINRVEYKIGFNFLKKEYSQTVKIEKYVKVSAYKTENSLTIQNDLCGESHASSYDPIALFDSRCFTCNISNKNFDFQLLAARTLLDYLRDRFKNVFLISGERGRIDSQLNIANPQRQIQHKTSPLWVGYRGEHVIEILSRYFTREQKIALKIQEWADKFQIPEIHAGYVGNGKLETNFFDKQFETSLNASLAGLGSRQILPIIVQIFSAEPESVILIEEPEISLHPESQVLLDELFATAVSEGKQIICTTHSPFMILAINRIVKKGLIKAEDIAIYHVEKDSEGTKTTQLALNKNGFLDSGIPSFMKIEQELLRDWTDTIED
ncbi:MAG: AAA family ATPase [Candidatus Bathyarchaeia archaeon]|jgi:predicted ATPase